MLLGSEDVDAAGLLDRLCWRKEAEPNDLVSSSSSVQPKSLSCPNLDETRARPPGLLLLDIESNCLSADQLLEGDLGTSALPFGDGNGGR